MVWQVRGGSRTGEDEDGTFFQDENPRPLVCVSRCHASALILLQPGGRKWPKDTIIAVGASRRHWTVQDAARAGYIRSTTALQEITLRGSALLPSQRSSDVVSVKYRACASLSTRG